MLRDRKVLDAFTVLFKSSSGGAWRACGTTSGPIFWCIFWTAAHPFLILGNLLHSQGPALSDPMAFTMQLSEESKVCP